MNRRYLFERFSITRSHQPNLNSVPQAPQQPVFFFGCAEGPVTGLIILCKMLILAMFEMIFSSCSYLDAKSGTLTTYGWRSFRKVFDVSSKDANAHAHWLRHRRCFSDQGYWTAYRLSLPCLARRKHYVTYSGSLSCASTTS